MTQFSLKIVTPEGEVYSDYVEMVSVPSIQGELGILAHHINFMTQLKAGQLTIKKGSSETIMATGGGILQMVDNQLSILTDLATESSEIDEKKVEEARKRAEEALEQKLSAEEYATTIANLEKSLAQLNVKRRHKV